MIRIPEYLERRRGPDGANGSAAHASAALLSDELEPARR
jgi:hypothetical protein